MPSFYLKNRRYVFLTYSQSGPELDYWGIVELLGNMGAECIIGRELHKNGGIHFHVFIDFGRLFSTRKTDVFDVGGQHPNILPVTRTPAKAYDYACKDGDVVAGGLGRPGGDSDCDPDSFWSTASHAGSAEEFLHLCDQLAPRDLIRGFPAFRAYSNWKWDRVPEYDQPEGVEFDTSAAEGIDEWVAQSAIGVGSSRERYVFGYSFAITLAAWQGHMPRANGTLAARACLQGGPWPPPPCGLAGRGPPIVALLIVT